MKKKKWLIVFYLKNKLIDVMQKEVSYDITENEVVFLDNTIFFFFNKERISLDCVQMPISKIESIATWLGAAKIISGQVLYCPGIPKGQYVLFNFGFVSGIQNMVDAGATVKFIAP